jgi:hypothetical protein
MRICPVFLVTTLLAAAVSAHADIIIDNFTCPDSISTTGPSTVSNVISCPSSIGGVREDVIFFTGGSGSNPSTLNSGSGSITGAIGSGLDAQDILLWSGSTMGGVWDLPDLDLVGDSVLVQIESPSGGTLDVTLGSGAAASLNFLDYTESFPVSSSFTDVLIPLTSPIVTGTGAELSDVTVIGLHVDVAGGGSWTMDGISIVPEPRMTWPLGAFVILGFVVLPRRRVSHRTE